jgi:predicted transcriptional regulator
MASNHVATWEAEMGIETKRVEEIMIPLADYPHVQETATLKAAMKAMLECQLFVAGQGTLPRIVLIFNSAHELAGMARRRDIMRGLEPEFLVSSPLHHRKGFFDVTTDANLPELFFDRVVKGIKERSARKVSEVMLPLEFTIDHDDHIMKAIYEMVDKNQSLLPVLKEGEVIGVVRSVDVFRELSGLLFEPGEESANCDGGPR